MKLPQKPARWWAGLPTAILAALLWVDVDLGTRLADRVTTLTHRIRGRRP